MAQATHPPRAKIIKGQLAQLRSLVAELFPANSFYSRKLGDAGVTFDVASLGDFSRRFPFTTKQELVEDQRAHPPFGSNLTYPLERYTRFNQTSGTSGLPLRWLDTSESWDAMVDCWTEIYRAAGITSADHLYFACSFGPFLGFWVAFEAATRLGALCIPGGGLSSAARLRAMIDNGANVLCCTPTYALRLAEVAAEEKINLQDSLVRTILVAGEPGGSIPAFRARLEQAWPGVRVFDHHGMTETGPVTYECPLRPGVLHIVESAFYAEVIDPATGKHVGPGETGELVLTTLARTASPVLRYRTGDIVHVDQRIKDFESGAEKQKLTVNQNVETLDLEFGTGTCVCGRNELSLVGGILGRTDDMVVI
ncbi:MAG TPA: AMP-binding protein, partial [Verrucomicrobiae bacterium]|nr:AMP-binding protein [Verrucomicrobiae bacterium]